jgi:hypothetical protein
MRWQSPQRKPGTLLKWKQQSDQLAGRRRFHPETNEGNENILQCLVAFRLQIKYMYMYRTEHKIILFLMPLLMTLFF